MFVSKTWPVLLLVSVIWIALLLTWIFLPPPFIRDLVEFDQSAATKLDTDYKPRAIRIRNLWVYGGISALLAYIASAIVWPHSNWVSESLVPLFRLIGEILVGFSFSQAVDLVFRPVPILARVVSGWTEFSRLGSRGRAVMFLLRNVNVLFALLLVTECLVHYQRTESDILLSVAAALLIGRYIDSAI